MGTKPGLGLLVATRAPLISAAAVSGGEVVMPGNELGSMVKERLVYTLDPIELHLAQDQALPPIGDAPVIPGVGWDAGKLFLKSLHPASDCFGLTHGVILSSHFVPVGCKPLGSMVGTSDPTDQSY
jgi:hypothetical protein